MGGLDSPIQARCCILLPHQQQRRLGCSAAPVQQSLPAHLRVALHMAHHCLAKVGMLLLALCIDIVHAIHHLQGQMSNEWAPIAKGRQDVGIGLHIHLTGQ